MDIRKFVSQRVEGYLEASGMTPTRFGLDALNDRSFVFQLRGDPKYGLPRNPTLSTINRVLAFIDGDGSFEVSHDGRDSVSDAA